MHVCTQSIVKCAPRVLNMLFTWLHCTRVVSFPSNLGSFPYHKVTPSTSITISIVFFFTYLVNLFMFYLSLLHFRFFLLVLSDYSLTLPLILEHLSYYLFGPMVLHELSSTFCGSIHCSKLPLFQSWFASPNQSSGNCFTLTVDFPLIFMTL